MEDQTWPHWPTFVSPLYLYIRFHIKLSEIDKVNCKEKYLIQTLKKRSERNQLSKRQKMIELKPLLSAIQRTRSTSQLRR